MKEFVVKKNDANQRIDKFVSKTTTGLPKSLLYKYLRTKRIKLNGKKAHEGDFVSEGDVVEMYIPDEFFDDYKGEEQYDKIKFTPDIVYEDENILLCDKKPGMLVHLGDEGDKNRAEGSEKETLIYLLTAYLVNKGEYNPKDENSFAPALCNRIDRNTGGIVILAKNAEALRVMNAAIRDDRVHKKYLCAVHGKLKGEQTLTAYHRKDYKTNTVKIYADEVPGAKKIVTGYRSLGYNAEHDLTLLEIKLITGRTHQIRAHMAFIGHPLLGEGKYAQNAADKKMGYLYQALYSYSVEFDTDGILEYLRGHTYKVDTSRIQFLKLFGNVSI